MGLVTTWLTGIGLDHAVENFQAAGIVSPSDLAELEVSHFEALGVKEPSERRKLFYLIQRIKMSVEGKGEEVQQEVDAVLSKSMNSITGKLEKVESTERQPSRRETGHERHTKENNQDIPAKPKGRVGRPATLQPLGPDPRSSSLKTPAVSLAAHSVLRKENGEREKCSTKSAEQEKDSDWEEDGDSSVIADDEASLRCSGRRGSRRLHDLRMRQEAEGSMADTESIQTDTREAKKGDSTRRTTGRRANVATTGRLSTESQPTKRHSTEMPRRTSSLSDADDEASISSSGLSSHTAQKVDPPALRRRFESKLQNPNTRTGKALSSIPAGYVAPMSPLIELPSSKLDTDVSAQQKVDQKIRTSSISSIAQGKRLSFGEASSDTESDSRARRPRDSSTSGSDTDRQSGHRRIGRQSVEAVKPTRLSTGSIGTKSVTIRKSFGGKRSNSSRDLVSSGSFDAENQGSTKQNFSVVGRASDVAPVFVHGTTEDTSWSTQVARLREDNQCDHELFHNDTEDDNWDDEEMRIRVLIRKRPKSPFEVLDVDIIQSLDYNGYGRVLVYQPKTRVDLTKQVETFPFAFDNVFGEFSTNTDIYNRAVRNLIPGVFDGRWASCFAYGQTGSG